MHMTQLIDKFNELEDQNRIGDNLKIREVNGKLNVRKYFQSVANYWDGLPEVTWCHILQTSL